MKNNTPGKLSIIIRASGEATLENLTKQLQKLKHPQDVLIVLDSAVSFEKKLKEGFERAIEMNNPFTVFIDADILLRSNALRKIRNLCSKLLPGDLGFGLKLWDRFYDRPKFRGLHVYRTSLLRKALNFIPIEGTQLRPESYVKKMMKNEGYSWRNEISEYIAGIHDFYQRPEDIYYKFLIRSRRSTDDLPLLKKKFDKRKSEMDFKNASRGLRDGLEIENIHNNKTEYVIPNEVRNTNFEIKNVSSFKVDFLIWRNCMRYYGFSKSLFNSL